MAFEQLRAIIGQSNPNQSVIDIAIGSPTRMITAVHVAHITIGLPRLLLGMPTPWTWKAANRDYRLELEIASERSIPVGETGDVHCLLMQAGEATPAALHSLRIASHVQVTDARGSPGGEGPGWPVVSFPVGPMFPGTQAMLSGLRPICGVTIQLAESVKSLTAEERTHIFG